MVLPVHRPFPCPALPCHGGRTSSKDQRWWSYLSTGQSHAPLSNSMGQDKFKGSKMVVLPVHRPCSPMPHSPIPWGRTSSKDQRWRSYLSTGQSHAPLSHSMGAGQVQLQGMGPSLLQVEWEMVVSMYGHIKNRT